MIARAGPASSKAVLVKTVVRIEVFKNVVITKKPDKWSATGRGRGLPRPSWLPGHYTGETVFAIREFMWKLRIWPETHYQHPALLKRTQGYLTRPRAHQSIGWQSHGR